jgi:hypothetical protein
MNHDARQNDRIAPNDRVIFNDWRIMLFLAFIHQARVARISQCDIAPNIDPVANDRPIGDRSPRVNT